MPAKTATPSAAVQAARARRGTQAAARDVRVEWFLENVVQKLDLTFEQRVRLAVGYLQDKIVRNISKPVGKGKGARSGRMVVTERSKPGEYPRADTTLLMKSIIGEVRQGKDGSWEGYVGTPLDYGLVLETSERLDRGFLVRTLQEQAGVITRILVGRIA